MTEEPGSSKVEIHPDFSGFPFKELRDYANTLADTPRIGDIIVTPEQYEATLIWCFERGDFLVVSEGFRPWIVAEDEHGDAWAWSWWEVDERDESEGDGPSGTVVPAELLRLPLTILYLTL